MHLAALRLVNVGPFADLALPLTDEAGKPRRVVVVHGGPGTGKSLILSAIAHTRPGHAQVPMRPGPVPGVRPHVVADWQLGQEDPARPHPLRVASPNAALENDPPMRRKEQQLFDRKAHEGGFVVVGIPAHRWFSRQAVSLAAPLRTVLAYDLRGGANLTDSTRYDLTRETKQTLAYAEAAGALAAGTDDARLSPDPSLLRDALSACLAAMLRPVGYGFDGLDPRSLEPHFTTPAGHRQAFDDLPVRVKNLVALVAIPVRTLFAGHRGGDPRNLEGVVLVDDVDLHLGPAMEVRIVDLLAEVLPQVQWIVTTGSATLAGACRPGDVVALRHAPDERRIDVALGPEAITH